MARTTKLPNIFRAFPKLFRRFGFSGCDRKRPNKHLQQKSNTQQTPCTPWKNPWQLFIHLHMAQGKSEAVDVEHV